MIIHSIFTGLMKYAKTLPTIIHLQHITITAYEAPVQPHDASLGTKCERKLAAQPCRMRARLSPLRARPQICENAHYFQSSWPFWVPERWPWGWGEEGGQERDPGVDFLITDGETEALSGNQSLTQQFAEHLLCANL